MRSTVAPYTRATRAGVRLRAWLWDREPWEACFYTAGQAHPIWILGTAVGYLTANRAPWAAILDRW
jgi:hypothetical protein